MVDHPAMTLVSGKGINMQHKSFAQMNRERMARAPSSRHHAPRSKDHGERSKKLQASSGLTRVEGYYRMKKTNKGEK